MIFKNEHHPSTPQKTLFTVVVVLAAFAGLVRLAAGAAAGGGAGLRCALMAGCLLLYVLRLQATVWVFQQRRWTWAETAIITVLMSFALLAYAWAATLSRAAAGWPEGLGLLLVLAGSWLNTKSELDRHRWKARPGNKGMLYTEGLFRHARHINYFGDLVLFAGMSLATRAPGLLLIPLVMALNFVVNIIPALDRHLEQTYGPQYREHAGRTRRLVPWLY